MIKYLFILLTAVLSPLLTGCAEANLTHSVALVPRPTQLVSGSGNYLFSKKTVFAVENKEQAEVVELLTGLFTRAAGFTPEIKLGSQEGDIRLITDTALKDEAYILKVSPKEVLIKASNGKGFFYALQTIRQLLPSNIESDRVTHENIHWEIPTLTIADEPRFGYRGMMLDVARYFMPKENVLRIIDCMGMLKLNKLHFHLGDDNGWRLEIKKYPRLTEVGAWRVDRKDIPFPARRNPEPGEPTPVGGFYTQEDIKEIVTYAAQRQIEVIPEIEMPAHSNAALASYPQLACPVVDKFIGVLPGLGGDHADIIYCAGNDSVFTFLQNVIDEMVTLFPSQYIHLGGDEAWKTNWKKCPLCQSRIKKEHLADEEDLQGYFMNRMADYVRSKGKEGMGWDELTNSKLPEGAIIYGWQGYGQAALKAAAQGHRFIMTPARVMYLIRYQGPQWFEPLTYFGNNTLKDVYDYEPIQENWKPEYASLLMGVQASMWTEFCNKPEDVEYQIFPRLVALAEVAWVRPEDKDWTSFLEALDCFTTHLDKKGITVARSMYNIQHTVTAKIDSSLVKLECIRPDVEIRFTTGGGKEPAADSELYKEPIVIKGTKVVQCATFSKGKQMGEVLTLIVFHNKATGKPLLGNKPNEAVLTNGVRGSLKYTDFEWCGWKNNDHISFTVDLQKGEKLEKVIIGSITNYGMAVHKPKSISVAVSDDNVTYRDIASLNFTPEEIFREGTFTENLEMDMKGVTARYVKVTAEGVGACPENHVRPGEESKVYFDEVIIQ